MSFLNDDVSQEFLSVFDTACLWYFIKPKSEADNVKLIVKNVNKPFGFFVKYYGIEKVSLHCSFETHKDYQIITPKEAYKIIEMMGYQLGLRNMSFDTKPEKPKPLVRPIQYILNED